MVSCRNLTKRFGDFTAVDHVSFDIPDATICGILGPNGAGKSTLLKMLTGLIPPTHGTATVAGHDILSDAVGLKHAVGVIPENLGLFDDLTIEEHLRLCGPVYDLPREEARRRREDLLNVLGLSQVRHTFGRQCSHGMRKKTALGMALMHNPAVLFLDEPFEGIDPVGVEIMRRVLLAMTHRGATVVLTSHSLPLISRLASQIIVIGDGRIAIDSKTADLPKIIEELYFDLVHVPEGQDLPWLGSRQS